MSGLVLLLVFVAVSKSQSPQLDAETAEFLQNGRVSRYHPAQLLFPLSNSFHLPDGVAPLSYDLTLKVDIPSDIYSLPDHRAFITHGMLNLTIKCTQFLTVLELNAEFLEIRAAFLDQRSLTVSSDALNQKIGLFDGRPIEPGTHNIKLFYNGKVADRLQGFFKSFYMDDYDRLHIAAATHFETNYARRFVPCFDEPRFKTPWRLRILHPSLYTATSNTPLLTQYTANIGPELVKVSEFEVSPPMPSYTLALLIHEFETMSNYTQSGTKVSILGPALQSVGQRTADAISTGPYLKILQPSGSLQAASHVLQYFENAFSMKYALKKYDSVILKDYPSSAMENWGLTMYNGLQISNLETIAHEAVHQWFGNLVSPATWEDMWLNEGSAEFFKFVYLSSSSTQYIPKTNPVTLHLALENYMAFPAGPIAKQVNSRFVAEKSMDMQIFYKMHHIFFMLKDLMGWNKFLGFIQNYLRKFSFKNASTKDFLAYLAEVDAKASRVMSSFLYNGGIPIITISQASPGSFLLTQKRYYKSKIFTQNYDDRLDVFWNAGLRLLDLDTSQVFEHELQKTTYTYLNRQGNLPIIDSTNYLMAVVNYGDSGWPYVFRNGHKISPQLRQLLYIDLVFSADYGLVSHQTVLFIFNTYLTTETDTQVLEVMIYEFEKYASLAEDRRAEIVTVFGPRATGTTKEFLKNKYATDFSKMTESAEQVEKTLFAPTQSFTKQQIDEAKYYFVEQFMKPCKQAPHLRASQCSRVSQASKKRVYCAALRADSTLGLAEVADFIWSMLSSEVDPFEAFLLEEALAECSVQWSFAEKLLRKWYAQDFHHYSLREGPIFALARNPLFSTAQLAAFLKNNWMNFKNNYNRGTAEAVADLQTFIKILRHSNESRAVWDLWLSCPIPEVKQLPFWGLSADGTADFSTRLSAERRAALTAYLNARGVHHLRTFRPG